MQTNPRIKLLIIASLSLATISPVHSCSLISGYFYQVTALKGQVVGNQNFILQSIPWLRQSLGRNHAELTLYEYSQTKSLATRPKLKAGTADSHGNFDFGTVPPGHYTLTIRDPAWNNSNSFQVEIKSLPTATASVLIDISPIHPDCTGGHQIIVTTK
ncbi:MAG TPA: hypothetical protein VLA42_13570 [Verrucomicrobiae bacterium]|nr:hypothetical protein [Verrucomicrobiae bacterium]